MKKVLIVDDSALVRKQLSSLISELGFEIDIAKNGKIAVDMACEKDYDVITMDVNMPVMDGLTALKEIMEKNPTAVLMVSSLTSADATTTVEALELGAIDYVAKPGTMQVGDDVNKEEILMKVKSLSRIPKRRIKAKLSQPRVRERRRSPEVQNEIQDCNEDFEKVLLIGASTGGPGLIEQICSSLTPCYPYPVVIVQHMPEQFTEAFASRLNKVSSLEVVHTKSNMEIVASKIYLARGGVHLQFAKKVSGKIVIRESNETSGFFKPSVDEMFKSGVKVFGGSAIIGVLLTGIGDDGADGMVEIRKDGGYTIGESEDSATVYGMPKEAFDRGGVQEQLPFNRILKKIATFK